jgi:hypothetical protein
LISNERCSWENHEHGLVCSPYNAPINSSPRSSLKSEKRHHNCTWKKEKYNKKGIKKLEIRKRTEQSHLRSEKKSNKRYIMLGTCLSTNEVQMGFGIA